MEQSRGSLNQIGREFFGNAIQLQDVAGASAEAAHGVLKQRGARAALVRTKSLFEGKKPPKKRKFFIFACCHHRLWPCAIFASSSEAVLACFVGKVLLTKAFFFPSR